MNVVQVRSMRRHKVTKSALEDIEFLSQLVISWALQKASSAETKDALEAKATVE